MCIKSYILLVLLVLSLICVETICKKPNFVLFLTDDQDLLLDGMVPMQSTIKYIANKGLTFTEAYVHSPICCPSRSSLLTGKYLHNLHVFNNSLSGNCSSVQWQNIHETKSIAALLKNENYLNFYAGKYLNQYGNKKANGLKHIPVGYDWWYGLEGNSKYYNFSLSINGTKASFNKEYLTDLMGKFADDFLTNKTQNLPFFMVLATPAAHAPFTAADRHLNKFPGIKKKITPNFNVSAINKHWLLQLPPKNLPQHTPLLDDIQRKRLQTLLSVDELVEKVINKLKNLNLLDDTYLIFTSDNGFHIGQFSLPWDKRQPYQTDIHIPLLIKGPNIPEKQLFEHPVSLVDLAPTILTLANVSVPNDMDGVSFAHLLNKNKDKFTENTQNQDYIRNNIFIEYYGEGNQHSVQKECNFTAEEARDLSECTLENWCKCQDSRNNTYTCVIDFTSDDKMKYCLFKDNLNFVEVYNLKIDPYELTNIATSLIQDEHQYYQELLLNLKQCTGRSCNSKN